MTELTYAALREIMYARPVKVWLATEYSGDRWLHDQWVMLNVTGHPAIEGAPDGAYTLTVSKGLQPRDSIPPADLEAWFRGAEGAWVPASPSEWSVAEHPGKAMLWVAERKPCLLGENTWIAIKRHYPECAVYYLPSRNFFKFCYSSVNEDLFPFCFAAGIQVPTGQENIAQAIADLHSKPLTQLATAPTLEYESTSNEE